MVDNQWVQAPVWSEWRALTRLLYSGRVAFEAEISKWENAFIVTGDTRIAFRDGGGEFEVSLHDHLASLKEGSLFYSMIFLRAFSLLEGHAKLIRYIVDTNKWALLETGPQDDDREQIDAVILDGGVSNWATRLLSDVGQDWDRVYKHERGMREVALMRNALMHGYKRVSHYLSERSVNSGITLPFGVGQEIRLDFPLLHEYRGRIRSLCRILCDGVVLRHRQQI